MKRTIGFALASGLALVVAGCANMGGMPSNYPVEHANEPASATKAVAQGDIRNFNLAVKCPGVHWEKTHGWSDDKIIQHETIDSNDIASCEQWVANQPKGYVPPPPAGYASKNTGANGPGIPPPVVH